MEYGGSPGEGLGAGESGIGVVPARGAVTNWRRIY